MMDKSQYLYNVLVFVPKLAKKPAPSNANIIMFYLEDYYEHPFQFQAFMWKSFTEDILLWWTHGMKN